MLLQRAGSRVSCWFIVLQKKTPPLRTAVLLIGIEGLAPTFSGLRLTY